MPDRLLDAEKAMVGNAAFAEFSQVSAVRDVEADGYRVRRGMTGIVVSIYCGDEAYAVEFANLDDGMGVVTLNAADLVKAAA